MPECALFGYAAAGRCKRFVTTQLNTSAKLRRRSLLLGAPAVLRGATPEYDIVVCGGGTSGLPAAVAAAREGARVAIVERFGFMGGNPAFSIMPCWHGLTMHHSGLLTKFAQRVEEFGVGPSPLKQENHIEPEVVKFLFMQTALEANVHLHLHHFLAGVVRDGRQVRAILADTKSGRRTIASKVFVDASGDGDLSAYAGARFELGDKGKTQGLTLRFRIGSVDFEAFAVWFADHPELGGGRQLLERVRGGAGKVHGRGMYFASRIDKLYDRYRDKYPDLPSDTYLNCSSIRPNELSINTTRVYDLDPTNADDLTRAEIATRRQAWAVWRFLRDNVPGFENSVIVETAPQVGVRESRRIVGDYVLTAKDAAAHREFPDSILTCQTHWDSHDKGKYDTRNLSGLVDVPYGVLLAKDLDNVLIVGRTASCDHLMNSAFRNMENAFQSGEVGGTAAGMAVKERGMPRRLPVSQLQAELRKNGVLTSQADWRKSGRHS